MEAVPKLPMLSFELKISPVCPDFAVPFKRFISKYYGEDGDLYDREIIELESMRNNACRTARDFTGCSQLKRYYSQVYSLFNRFSAFEVQIGVQCVWADIYTGQTTIGDLDFELACILYNIGALHAELGASDSRQTAEEMKICCTHFQCAAWAFQHLMDNKKLYRSGDLSNDVLQFFVQIMLAQAQECILEKSMLDNRKPSIVAKVAAQVVEYYRSAISMLQQGAMNTSSQSSIIEVVGSKLFKEWKKFVEFKLTYYNSICSLYMGNAAEELQKMGERVSWYESADAKLKEALKLAKQLDSSVELVEAVSFVTDVITAKLSNAKKENDFIYHEKVIPPEQLPEVKGASLVKGIPFNICDPEVSGPDIFARLVPIEAHETASIYSARKDEILRNIRMKIEERNQELIAYLSSLQLEKDTLRTPKEDAIPDDLINICAELSLTPEAVPEVEETLTELEKISDETTKIIEESAVLLEEEEQKEKEYQEKFGKRPPSLIVVELSKELAKHRETHNKAILSNKSLWENFEQHKDDIIVMTSSSASKIASILPSNKNIKVDETIVTEMERLFDKIEEMKQQRAQLEEQLVKEMDSDNVLKLVLAHPKEEIEAIFDLEIKKYDKIVGFLEQNLAAQDNILNALTTRNAGYAETRKEVIEVQRNRKTRIASLLYTYQVFRELQANSKKGLEFYTKFQSMVTRLNARIRGVSKVQDEERAQVNKMPSPVVMPSMAVGSMPGTIAYPPSFVPSVPNIPVTGAKLKDYLPFMTGRNSMGQKGLPTMVPSSSAIAIPSASYLPPTSTVMTGPTSQVQPVSLSYPTPSATPTFAPSAPLHGPVLQRVSEVQPIPQSYPQSYLSPQAPVSKPSTVLEYSPPPTYSQALASTVSYSLPSLMTTTSITSVQPQIPYSIPSSQPQPTYQQQPISSVLPIQPQVPSWHTNLSNPLQASVGATVSMAPHSSVSYQSLPTSGQPQLPTSSSYYYPAPASQPPPQQQGVPTGYYPGDKTAPNQTVNYPVQSNAYQQPYSYSNLPNNYSNPSPYQTQSFANQPSMSQPQLSTQVPRPSFTSAQSGLPQVANQVLPSGALGAITSQMGQSHTQQIVQPTPLGAANVHLGAQLGSIQPSTQQIPTQPQLSPGPQQVLTMQPAAAQQSQVNLAYYSSTGQVISNPATSQLAYGSNQALSSNTSYPVANGQYVSQNQAADRVVQQIEQESKGGWPVLMPTVATQNGKPNGSTGTAAEALPDILATMSITSPTATVIAVSKATVNGTKETGAAQNNNIDEPDSNSEPKDLLSQFDPLFT